MKTRYCPLCNKSTTPLKTVDNTLILECKSCKIGITSRTKSTMLYKKGGLYDFNKYRTVEAQQKKKFKFIAEYIADINIKSVLEVGAGYGLFSKILSENPDLKIEVIEPNLKPFYILKQKQINKHKLTLNRFLLRNKKKFDLIVLLDVLEHLEDPEKKLNEIIKTLNKKGYLLLALPNYKSLMAIICKNWSWWMVEDHKYHFSPISIVKTLKKVGFNIVRKTTFEDWSDFKKNLDGNFSEIHNSVFRKILKGFFYLIFTPIYFFSRRFLWRFGFGGMLLVLARKK